MTQQPRRGQGTLEYVLMFVLVAVVLLVVGWVFREQVRTVGKKVVTQLQTMIKESGPDAKKSGSGSGESSGEGEDGKSGNSGSEESEEDGAKVEKRGLGEAEAAEEGGSFSLAGMSTGRKIIGIAAVIGLLLGITMFFKQGRTA